ncbi:MAG: hypothetical protein ACOX6Q_00765 [Candidatus Dojkabacteria bacterium]|jgi:hypothetical protein
MSTIISGKPFTRSQLLAAFYNATATPPGIRNFLMTEEDADRYLYQYSDYIDEVEGKKLYINLFFLDEIDVTKYNEFNGENLAQKVLNLLEQGYAPDSKEICTARMS